MCTPFTAWHRELFGYPVYYANLTFYVFGRYGFLVANRVQQSCSARMNFPGYGYREPDSSKISILKKGYAENGIPLFGLVLVSVPSCGQNLYSLSPRVLMVL